MKKIKIYVWGIGPAKSPLIQNAEHTKEAGEAAWNNCQDDFDINNSDAWAVEVTASDLELFAAMSFDPSIAGYLMTEKP